MTLISQDDHLTAGAWAACVQPWDFSVKTNKVVYFLSSFLFVAHFPGKMIILRVIFSVAMRSARKELLIIKEVYLDKFCVIKYVSMVFPLTSLPLQCQWKNNWSISMPVLEEGKLLFKEKLANEKSIDSTDDLARRKIRRFSWNSALWQRNRNAICGLWTSIKCVEMLPKTSILKNVHLIRWGIFKICD